MDEPGTPIDLEKMRSIGVQAGHSRHGDDFKQSRTDELGNTVTEHWGGRQDVTIRPQAVGATVGINGEGPA